MSKPASFLDFVWIWNRSQTLSTPRIHARISNWFNDCCQQRCRRLLLLSFRNSGKSTLVALYAAWRLYRNPDLRILTLSGEFSLAKAMVRQVRRIIERHPLTRSIVPARAEQWAADQFTVRRSSALRDASMVAKGISSNITGLRADLVICDDVEVPNTSDTLVKREDLRERLKEIEYVLVPDGTQIYIGTPHTYYSIYACEARQEIGETRPFLDGFERLEIPLVDEQGRSAWPERFPPERIEALRRDTGPAKFTSQMMLRPANPTDGRLDPDRLQRYDVELSYIEGNGVSTLSLGNRRLVSASCWWDPSFGSVDSGDASVVGVVFTDDAGNLRLHRIAYLRHDPLLREEVDEATQLCRQVADFVRDHYLPSVTVETNGLGRFLPSLLRCELRRAGLRCAVVEHVSTRSKDLRIIDAFDAVMAAGRLFAHHSVWDTPFVREMREWRPGRPGRDDGLDTVAGCLLSEPVRLPRFDAADRRPSAGHWQGVGAVIAPDGGFGF
jgi:hypothetical protein